MDLLANYGDNDDSLPLEDGQSPAASKEMAHKNGSGVGGAALENEWLSFEKMIAPGGGVGDSSTVDTNSYLVDGVVAYPGITAPTRKFSEHDIAQVVQSSESDSSDEGDAKGKDEMEHADGATKKDEDDDEAFFKLRKQIKERDRSSSSDRSSRSSSSSSGKMSLSPPHLSPVNSVKSYTSEPPDITQPPEKMAAVNGQQVEETVLEEKTEETVLSKDPSKSRDRKRSHSRDRKRSHRDRSRSKHREHRKHRSRSRSKDRRRRHSSRDRHRHKKARRSSRDRKRSRSRDRKRSRSRDRKRSKSKDRKRGDSKDKKRSDSKERKRSRSRDRTGSKADKHDRKGSRSRDHKEKKDRKRSRSKDRKRSRSKDRRRDRSRERKRDRKHRSRSKDRRSRSKDKERSRSKERLRSRSPVMGKKLSFKEQMRKDILNASKHINPEKEVIDLPISKRPGEPLKPSDLLKGVKIASGESVTPQMALMQTMAAMHQKAQELTGVAVPKYYNPAAVNPLKYAEQVQKRKLLWSKKPDDKQKEKDEQIETQWKSAFTTEEDGKTASKFRKLMGMKEGQGEPEFLNEEMEKLSEEQRRKHSELFERLDQEYQFARITTHTQRGVGLGFSSQVYDPNHPSNPPP